MDQQLYPQDKYAKYKVDIKTMVPYIYPVGHLKNLLLSMYIILGIFIACSIPTIIYGVWVLFGFICLFMLAIIYGIFNYKKIIREKTSRPDEPLETIKFPAAGRNEFSSLRRIFIKENVNLREKATDIVLYSFEVYNEAQQKVGFVKERWLDTHEMTNNLLLAKIAKHVPPEFLGTKEMDFYGADGKIFMKVRKDLRLGREDFVDILTPNDVIVAQLFKGFDLGKMHIFILNSKDQEAGHIYKSFFGWNAKVLDMNKVIVAEMNKKFSGVLRETFTSADSYNLSIISDSLDPHISIAVPFILDRLLTRGEQRYQHSKISRPKIRAKY